MLKLTDACNVTTGLIYSMYPSLRIQMLFKICLPWTSITNQLNPFDLSVFSDGQRHQIISIFWPVCSEHSSSLTLFHFLTLKQATYIVSMKLFSENATHSVTSTCGGYYCTNQFSGSSLRFAGTGWHFQIWPAAGLQIPQAEMWSCSTERSTGSIWLVMNGFL